ncbi:TetR/AcrR family transcriptional regulator [Pseudophaeobacter sp.]|uniref:TetR/AcrR family transcriptional regulator n=1 Tax=Pseudophaeobacter sp. TaxID=1971739 RepID=UPI0032977524
MPRAKSSSRTELVDSALNTFWKKGFHVVSMGDLVRETGVSRSSLYSDFASKEALFHACLDRYQEKVVTPAFGPVEQEAAGLAEIRTYLENLLGRAETSTAPYAGCLVLNTLAQITPQEGETLERLKAHGKRLHKGLYQALSHENQKHQRLDEAQIDALARFTLISVQGLWAQSRGSKDSAPLRQYCETLLALLANRLGVAEVGIHD